MNYEKFYLIGFWIATLYAFVMLPYNLERMQRMDTIETKTTTNTELLETEEDWKENLSATLQTLWTLIPQASANSNVKNAETYGDQKSNDIFKENQSLVTNTVKTADGWNSGSSSKIRTPKQIYEQVKCNAECKIETLTKLWITSTLSNLIVSECKEWSIDPRHCIIIASSIVINESGGGKSNACKARYNCFWFWWWKIIYTSYQESVANFVSTYSRKWYKAKDSSFFYPNKWEYSPSRYCVSESSSNSDIWCPFWQKHMQNTWNKLEKLF